MLYRIDNMLILADSKEDAANIYEKTVGKSIDISLIRILINRGESYVCLDKADVAVKKSAEDVFQTCMHSIQSKYGDPLKAVTGLVPYLKELNCDQVDEIFEYLLATKYNETKPLTKLCSELGKIPDDWFPRIIEHVSYFWIKYKTSNEEMHTDQFILETNNQKLLSLVWQSNKIMQSNENHEKLTLLEEAGSYNIKSRILRLLNSINFSLETLDTFVDNYPLHQWVLEHYEFKQNLFRTGIVVLYNDHDHQKHFRKVLQ
jgi:hypothetical protein